MRSLKPVLMGLPMVSIFCLTMGAWQNDAFSQPSPGATPTFTGTGIPSVLPSISPLPTVSVASGAVGQYLTNQTGRSLYIFQADTPGSGTSTCTGQCELVWPPFLVPNNETPQAAGRGIDSSLLGTIQRNNGGVQSNQATYNGWPLYFYAEDTAPGQTNGQGINSFNNLWYLINPAGAPITPAPAPTPNPTPSL
jgi:predicted lipoprotein with Yx(FWY)xxD motif